MRKKEEAYLGPQEEYMDDLIRLVYKQDRLQEIREIIERSKEPLTPAEEACGARVRQRMTAGLAAADRNRRRTKRQSGLFRILPRIMEIAACLIVIVAIGTTIAVASNATFRSAVLQLLVHIDREEGVVNIHFGENREEAFDVPAGWQGEYYLSRVPEGFEMVYMSTVKTLPTVWYETGDGRSITFDERDFSSAGTQGEEETDISYIMINDRQAVLVSGENPDEPYYRVTWSNDEKWFTLDTQNMTRDETIELARSVRKIIPTDP